MTIVEQNTASKTCLTFKGGLYPLTTCMLTDFNLDEINFALDNKIKQAPNFFRQAPVILEISSKDEISLENFTRVVSLFKSKNLIVVGIRTALQQLREFATSNGMAIFAEQSHRGSRSSAATEAQAKVKTTTAPTPKPTEAATPEGGTATRIIHQPIRSGQQIYVANGDLIVMSSVSAGAELLADGHIHVHGALRGRALAGINGDTDAIIYCKSLEAELVSIAGQYKISDALKDSLWKQPACIRMHQGALQIDTI